MKNILTWALILAFPAIAFAASYEDDSKSTDVKTNSGTISESVTDTSSEQSDSDDSADLDALSDFTKEDLKLMLIIKTNLRNDSTLGPAVQGIQITSHDGNVTLQGTVSSETEKRAIVDRIEKTNGVLSIDNQLRVQL